MAELYSFSPVSVCCITTSVSELAGNLFFHATDGGIITIDLIQSDSAIGLEVIAEDQGPGITNIELAMTDGFSTNGGLGGGLPGVRRLMDQFQINSSPDQGTRIIARKWKK